MCYCSHFQVQLWWRQEWSILFHGNLFFSFGLVNLAMWHSLWTVLAAIRHWLRICWDDFGSPRSASVLISHTEKLFPYLFLFLEFVLEVLFGYGNEVLSRKEYKPVSRHFALRLEKYPAFCFTFAIHTAWKKLFFSCLLGYPMTDEFEMWMEGLVGSHASRVESGGYSLPLFVWLLHFLRSPIG